LQEQVRILEDRIRCVQHKTDARSCNHCCGRKAVSTTYYECVFVDLLSQHATCTHRITLSSVACLVYSTFVHTVL